jgi:hypothetical protein
MAVLIHYCLCGGYRHHKRWLENLDMAIALLHLCHHIPVLYVPRGF